MVELTQTGSTAEIIGGFAPLLSARDLALLQDAALAEPIVASLRESLRQGPFGGGWDNVCWVGTWALDLDAVRCPVHLWYGDDDQALAPPVFGRWLRDHLPEGRLVVLPGEGHFGLVEHLEEVLRSLAPAAGADESHP